jgi:hypothetical protein
MEFYDQKQIFERKKESVYVCAQKKTYSDEFTAFFSAVHTPCKGAREKNRGLKKIFPRQRSLKFYSLEKKTASAMQIGHA